MGAWGEGLYDNDSALDELGDLLDSLDMHASATALATTIGLRAWLCWSLTDAILEAIGAHRDGMDGLSPAARELLQLVCADERRFSSGRSRPAELTEILGTYCDGPRHDALLTLPGSDAIIRGLAESAAQRLGDGLASAADLYEAATPLAHLGVLLELHDAGYASPTLDEIASWRRSVQRLDAATEDEREFFDAYVARIEAGLARLARAPGGAPQTA